VNFWNKLSSKEKTGLIFAFGFLAFAFMDQLVVSPIRTKIKQIDRMIDINEKQLSMNLRNVKQREMIEAQYEEYVDFIQKEGSDEEKVAKILGEIEVLARKSEVYLVDTKPHTPKQVDFYREFAVEIEGEGRMESLILFLHRLNSSDQLLRAEKVRLNIKGKTTGIIKASMLITKVLLY